MEIYIQESGQPVPSAISALHRKSSRCPLLLTPLPKTKVLAQWGPSIHSALPNAWVWLDAVLAKLKPDDVCWATSCTTSAAAVQN